MLEKCVSARSPTMSTGWHVKQDIELGVSFTYSRYCQLTVTLFPHTHRVCVSINLVWDRIRRHNSRALVEADDDISMEVWSPSNMMYLIKAGSTVREHLNPLSKPASPSQRRADFALLWIPLLSLALSISLSLVCLEEHQISVLLFSFRLTEWWASLEHIIHTIWIKADTNHV